MFDIHTHLLFGIDDGAADADESLFLLTELKKQGVQGVVMTPHFYSDEESIEDFCARRDEAYARNKAELLSVGADIVLGAEVYLTRFLAWKNDLDSLCFGRSKYILIELPTADHLSNTYVNLLNSIIGRGYIPIIAHVERYQFIKKDCYFAKRLKDMGCLLQLNISSLYRKRNRGISLKLLKNRWIDFVASDCHNKVKRYPVFSSALPLIEEKFGLDYLESLAQNSRKVFDAAQAIEIEED